MKKMKQGSMRFCDVGVQVVINFPRGVSKGLPESCGQAFLPLIHRVLSTPHSTPWTLGLEESSHSLRQQKFWALHFPWLPQDHGMPSLEGPEARVWSVRQKENTLEGVQDHRMQEYWGREMETKLGTGGESGGEGE